MEVRSDSPGTMPPMPAATVNTKTAEHRALRFQSIDELRAELQRIAAADRRGTLRCTGNWTAGQTFNHLATWINFGYDGFPGSLRPSAIVKFVLRFMKGRFLNGGLPKGVRIGRIPGGTLGTELMTTEQGLVKLETALKRAAAGAPTHPSPVFGMMSHDEFIRGTLRHAELHLGFLHP